MIELLANLQPLILVGMLILMYGIENMRPYLQKAPNQKQHDLRNAGMSLISFVINGLLSLGVLASVEWTASHQFGLLNQVNLPNWSEILIGLLLIDLGSYGVHNLSHRIPLLWRFHRVHHSDPNLNATSSLRFHPFEVVLTQGIYQATAVAVFGISMTTFIVYGSIALPLIILQHSNVKWPDWIEQPARYIIATPGWHKIHHSDDRPLTDSHFGDVFTFWDRIFGTWKPTRPEEVQFGLNELKEDSKQSIGYQMMLPFKK